MSNIDFTSKAVALILFGFIISTTLNVGCELSKKPSNDVIDKVICKSEGSINIESVDVMEGIGNDKDYKDTFRITFNVAFLYSTKGGVIKFMEKVDKLNSSIDFLNTQFEGGVIFNYRDTIWEDTTSLVIEDLMMSGDWTLENDLSSMYEDDGYINLIVLPSRGLLNGYTFRPQDDIEDPRWNRIFLSINALGGTTLAHEVAHFMGLQHVANKETCAFHMCENIMSYCQCRDHFSDSQFDTMYSVLVDKRSYLVH